MYRRRAAGLEVLLAHPGGPFWSKKDDGVWSIPKGEVNSDEDFLKAAIREFKEEIGASPDEKTEFLPLGEIKQKAGKIVHAWAFCGDLPPNHKITGGRFEVPWPPRSGKLATFPEIDRTEFFTILQAKKKILERQQAFLDRLVNLVG